MTDGAEVTYFEQLDKDPSRLDAGQGLAVPVAVPAEDQSRSGAVRRLAAASLRAVPRLDPAPYRRLDPAPYRGVPRMPKK